VVCTECETCKWQIEMSAGVPVMNPVSILALAVE
jgi:glycerol-3-phosphate dehydrogenase subunit C